MVFVMRRGATGPISMALGNIAEGELVYINENGNPMEYYVAAHNYESGLNGTGKTLLVRQYIAGNTTWDTPGSVPSTFSQRFSPAVRQKIQETTVYYTPQKSGIK